MARRSWWLIFLLPCLGLLVFSGNFYYLDGSSYTDLAISHFPNAVWIQRAWQQESQIPLWSTSILSGYPLSANPLSGLHYPPAWLALLFPQPFGLNLLSILHIVVLGVGVYYFLRREGLGWLPALFGAVAVESMPKLVSHLGAGHVSLVYAIAWTPWLLAAQQSPRKRWWLAGLVLGLIILADPRWAAMAGPLWLAYGLRSCLKKGGLAASLGAWAGEIAASGAVALCVGAGLLLPLLEYTQLSTRSLMTAADRMNLSLPPLQFIRLLAPPFGSMAEWVLYPGGFLLALTALGTGVRPALEKARFWLAVGLAALFVAFGSYIPGMDLLSNLPGFDLIRVPARALFIMNMALAFGAASTLQVFCEQPGLLRSMRRVNSFLLLAAVLLIEVALVAAGWGVTLDIPVRDIWGALAFAAAAAVIWMLRRGRIGEGSFAIAGIVLVLMDLCLSNWAGLDFKLAQAVLAEGGPVVGYLRENANGARIYSPSYSIPQQTAALAGLELVDGVDPLQLRSYADFMAGASGVAVTGYSVTLPPMASGAPETDNAGAVPDPVRLGILHAGYVAAEFNLDAAGLIEVARFGNTRIYQNQRLLPWAWVQDPGRELGEGMIGEAFVQRASNKIEARAAGPGLLVFSEINYPGWTARVDGQEQEVFTVGGLLRGLMLDSGEHHVELAYKPVMFYFGAAASLAGFAFCGVFALIGLNKSKSSTGPAGIP